MIGFLRGKVLETNEKGVTLDVSGVGYRILLPLEIALRLSESTGKEISLWVHLSVRENALDLFGFEEKEDRDFFELLITVPGIGPRSALSVLNATDRQTLLSAIHSKETAYLTKISGIGKKTAEKIIMELEGKISSKGLSPIQGEEDVLEALKALGYGEREAREGIKKLPKELLGTSARIKEALKILGTNPH